MKGEKKKKRTDYGSLMTVSNIMGAKFCYERRQEDCPHDHSEEFCKLTLQHVFICPGGKHRL